MEEGTETKAAVEAPVAAITGESDKSYLVLFLLAYLLGMFGADRFYRGQVGLGILKLVTLGACGIWALVDTIIILGNTPKDEQGRPFKKGPNDQMISIAIFIVGIIVGGIYRLTSNN